MDSLTAWSPSSLQLRPAFHCSRSNVVLVWPRLRTKSIGTRLLVIAQAGGHRSNVVDARRYWDWWNGSEQSIDSFSGWSSPNNVVSPHNCRKQDYLKGALGAAAGFVFCVGLSFSAISHNNRQTSRLKQMDLVTLEVALASNHQSGEVAESGEGLHIGKNTEMSSFQEHSGSSLEDVSTVDPSELSYDSYTNAIMTWPTSRCMSNYTGTDDYLDSFPVLGRMEPLSGSAANREEDNPGCLPDDSKDTNISESIIQSDVKLEPKLNATQISGTSFRPVLMNAVKEEPEMYDEGGYCERVIDQNLLPYDSIPAPLSVLRDCGITPGKVLVPPAFDEFQEHTFKALQDLKVIEEDAKPGDLCTRREYARWLVSASSIFSRNSFSKVYPAMFIDKVTELAFDDVTPQDRDFSFIQGMAEAGIISSKLSRNDLLQDDGSPLHFLPESPLSRQDLVTWKLAVEKRHLPVVDRKMLHKLSGFIDIDKIHTDAWPALAADLSAQEHGVISRAFGYTKLFQPDKPVVVAHAAIALASGQAADVIRKELTCIKTELAAKQAIAAREALFAQAENEINQNFERELSKESEKIRTLEKLIEQIRQEWESLRFEREEEDLALKAERAAIESESRSVTTLRGEVERQLYDIVSMKLEFKHERERICKLHEAVENEKDAVWKLRCELDVERRALSVARAWAEEEASRAREQAKMLEEARARWERKGIKVVVDRDLREAAAAGVTWRDPPALKRLYGVEKWVEGLKAMASEVTSRLHQGVFNGLIEVKRLTGSVVENSAREVLVFRSAFTEKANQIAGNCREGMQQISQKFKP